MSTKNERVRHRVSLLVATLLVACADSSAAADISSDHTDGTLDVILVLGEIEPGDGAKFRREAALYDDAVVFLESPGGSTLEAIEIGETIRLKGFSTAVSNQSQCDSACGLIWLAGTPRLLARSGRIGFHATYLESNGRQAESGLGNALVGRYFTLLNLPEKAVVFATSAAPNSLNWLTANNHLDVGIETTIVDDLAEEEPAPIPPPINISRSSQPVSIFDKSGYWSIVIDHTLDDSCFLITTFDDGTTLRLGLDLAYTRGSYVMLGNDAWRSLRIGDQHALVFTFEGQDPWDVPSTVTEMPPTKALLAKFSDASFWQEFVESPALEITRGGRMVARLNLDGSARAFDKLMDCQRVANAARGPIDPFAD